MCVLVKNNIFDPGFCYCDVSPPYHHLASSTLGVVEGGEHFFGAVHFSAKTTQLSLIIITVLKKGRNIAITNHV